MKKFIFLLSMVMLTAVMFACGQKSGDEGKDGASAQEPKIPMAKVIDKAMYSAGLPKGWAVMVEEDSEMLAYRGDASKLDEFSKDAFIMANVKPTNGKKADELHGMLLKEMNAKALADVTMYGSTFKAAKMNDSGMDMLVLLQAKGKNMFVVMVPYAKKDDKELRAVIGSLKMKGN